MIQLLLPCWFWYAVIGIIFAVATLQQADEAGLDTENQLPDLRDYVTKRRDQLTRRKRVFLAGSREDVFPLQQHRKFFFAK
jgi:hypothetical protein